MLNVKLNEVMTIYLRNDSPIYLDTNIHKVEIIDGVCHFYNTEDKNLPKLVCAIPFENISSLKWEEGSK